MREPKDTYQKQYKMRTLGREKRNTVVSIPKEVIEREARKRGLTPQEFIEQYIAVAQYDNFDGIFYSFEKSQGNGKGAENA